MNNTYPNTSALLAVIREGRLIDTNTGRREDLSAPNTIVGLHMLGVLDEAQAIDALSALGVTSQFIPRAIGNLTAFASLQAVYAA